MPFEPTPARPAASVIVLRDGAAGPEVLLVERNPEQRFMGGAWVFPGGALHDGDAGPAAAGLRELAEEAGVELPGGTDALVPFSRWITPSEVETRFDTWFFVAEAPQGVEPVCDGSECVDHRWIRPPDALGAGERGELMLVFPTIKHLEQLAQFDSVAAALAAARARDVAPIQPRVVMRDGRPMVVLPGEPGYDG
jgi:8-oxo-dGTP pyrophosphatase MutT (NUDIX family)